MRGRLPLALLCVAGAVLAGTATTAAPAVAAACSGVRGDVNGDGHADLVEVGGNSGRPGERSNPRVLHVFYGTSDGVAADATGSALDDQVFTDDDVQGVPVVSVIGRSLLVSDLDADGCSDVVVGGNGTFIVWRGTPQGLVPGMGGHNAYYGSIDSLLAPDAFVSSTTWLGSVLAAGDFDADGYPDLALGDPADTRWGLNPQLGGTVFILYGSLSGPGLGLNRTGQVIRQDSPGVPGAAEKGDEMGAALAAGDFDGDGVDDLAVGVPGENQDRGAVMTFHGVRGKGLSAKGAATGQSSASVPGAPLPHVGGANPFYGGRFGGLMAAGDVNGDGRDDLALRSVVPDGKTKVRMATTVLLSDPTAKTAPWAAKSRNLVIAGRKTGTDYPGGGAPLLVAGLDADRYADLVVGDPKDVVGGRTAGSVTVYRGGPKGVATSGRRITQATPGVAGTPEEYDLFGSALTAIPIQDGRHDNLVVSAGGEWVGPGSRPSIRWDGDIMQGLITQLAIGAGGPTASGSITLTLDTPGVKGTVEADHSGWFGNLLG